MKICKIRKCIRNCPFYKTEQGGVMYCDHPASETMEQSYIITHKNGHDGVPQECPLVDQPVTFVYEK